MRKKCTTSTNLVLLVVVAATFVSNAPARDEISAAIENMCQQAVDSGKTVGLSVGVARADTIIFAEGFGSANLELGVPATKDTVYRIGSVTKEFTAAAVLLLVEDGRIQLDAPISKYLPDYPEHGRSATIRQLLQHTSGLKDFTHLPNYRKERPLGVSQSDILNRFQHLPLEFPSGEKHRYCNSGYFLLAVIIEKVAGTSFDEFIKERLFLKLSLRRTYCDRAARIIPGRASGYTSWRGELMNAPFINLNQTIGAGNLASTVADLITWQRSLVDCRLLRADSVKLMTRRGQLVGGKPFNYGLGVRITKVDGRTVIRHGGGISGFRADVSYYPDTEVAIAVLANTHGFNVTKLADQIARRVVTAKNKPISDTAIPPTSE